MTIRSKKIVTDDGSITYFHPDYGQNYHSSIGARREAREKFLNPSQILSISFPRLLDIGFGLGYNAFEAFLSHRAIDIVSLEQDRNILQDLEGVHKDSETQVLLQALKDRGFFEDSQKSLRLIFGDAREEVRGLLSSKLLFDVIFLDAFSPPTNPELWTIEFFKDLYKLLKEGGCLLTYSSALSVMFALRKTGFHIRYTPSVGRARGGLIAWKTPVPTEEMEVFQPLTPKEEFFLEHSVRALPNIDRHYWKVEKIQEYRKKLSELAVRLGFFLPHKRVEKIWKKQEEEGDHG